MYQSRIYLKQLLTLFKQKPDKRFFFKEEKKNSKCREHNKFVMYSKAMLIPVYLI